MSAKEKDKSSNVANRGKAAAQRKAEPVLTAKSESTKRNAPHTALLIVSLIVVLVIVIAALLTVLLSRPGVPFSTFKSNFYSASNVAIVATYANESQYIAESACFPTLREIVSEHRNASTVLFFLINASNSTCTFSPTISPISIETKPASYCLSIANSEPSIFLNYSSTNSSIVTAYRLKVFGNAQYMQQCPIAIDMS